MGLIGRRSLLGLAAVLALAGRAEARPVRVVMRTEAGDISLELYPDKAPITVRNFLAYIDKGLLNGSSFYRTVRPDNDPNPARRIVVIQGGRNDAPGGFTPIAHETTEVTGISHTDGVISMARDGPGTATSEFFICIGDNRVLDFGGVRNPDGQGFAAFGKVIKGMDVVRKINGAPTEAAPTGGFAAGQFMKPEVKILSVKRR